MLEVELLENQLPAGPPEQAPSRRGERRRSRSWRHRQAAVLALLFATAFGSAAYSVTLRNNLEDAQAQVGWIADSLRRTAEALALKEAEVARMREQLAVPGSGEERRGRPVAQQLSMRAV